MGPSRATTVPGDIVTVWVPEDDTHAELMFPAKVGHIELDEGAYANWAQWVKVETVSQQNVARRAPILMPAT